MLALWVEEQKNYLWLHFSFVCIYQSLKSRGIRFPGRDNESLAPIFTPPRTISASETEASYTEQFHHDIPVHTFTAEETKEAFDVARNSIELLSTVLSSSPPQDSSEVMHLFHSVLSFFLSLSHSICICFKLLNMWYKWMLGTAHDLNGHI